MRVHNPCISSCGSTPRKDGVVAVGWNLLKGFTYYDNQKLQQALRHCLYSATMAAQYF
jgi:hypothetical protein